MISDDHETLGFFKIGFYSETLLNLGDFSDFWPSGRPGLARGLAGRPVGRLGVCSKKTGAIWDGGTRRL